MSQKPFCSHAHKVQKMVNGLVNDPWMPIKNLEVCISSTTLRLKCKENIDAVECLCDIVRHMIDAHEELKLQRYKRVVFNTNKGFALATTTDKGVVQLSLESVCNTIAHGYALKHQGPIPDYFPYDRLPELARKHARLLDSVHNKHVQLLGYIAAVSAASKNKTLRYLPPEIWGLIFKTEACVVLAVPEWDVLSDLDTDTDTDTESEVDSDTDSDFALLYDN